MINVGDTITVRDNFGAAAPRKAVIQYMEMTDHPRQKYGVDTKSVPVALVQANQVVFGIRYEGADTDSWCYSDQVDL